MTDIHVFDPKNNSDSEPWFELIYQQAFRDFVSYEVVTDVRQQKAGIDHRVFLTNNRRILADVKVRSSFWDDVLIEVWSNKERRVPGWSRKPLHADYIVYAFKTKELAYVIPFQLLQRVYETNKQKWKTDGLQQVHARNVGYTTVSVAVPWKRLRDELSDAMEISFRTTPGEH